jgi:hypothetical protein
LLSSPFPSPLGIAAFNRGSCTSSLCIDLTKAANSHASVMGVFAGFAVAALAVLLARSASTSGQSEPARDGTQALFLALLTFIVAAFLYGTASGDEAGPQRVAAMTLAAGLVASTAVSILIFGLLQLLSISARSELTARSAILAALLVSSLTSVLIYASVVDLFRSYPAGINPGVTTIVIAALLGIATVSFFATPLLPGTTLERIPIVARTLGLMPTKRARASYTPFALASFLLLGSATVYFFLLLYLPESAFLSWPFLILLGVWLGFSVTYVRACASLRNH